VIGTSGGFPILAGGTSCEAAQAAYVEEMSIGGSKGPADLTAGAYQSILGNGAYLNRCGVPENMSVSVCAAVQMAAPWASACRPIPKPASLPHFVAGRGINFRAIPSST
jgi:hypothetical protein